MYQLNPYMIIPAVHCISTVLNFATVVIIIAVKRLRKIHNIFTGNIALVDCVSSSLNVALSWPGALKYKYKRDFGLVSRAMILIGACSTLSVAIHRYIIIRFDPFNKRKLVTAPRCFATSVLIWAIPIAAFFGTKSVNENSRFQNLIVAIATVVSYGLCVVCYAVVYRTIAGAPRKAGLSGRMLEQRLKQNKEVLTTFALVVGTNVVCFLPLSFCFFINYVRLDWTVNLSTLIVYIWFYFLFNISLALWGLSGIINAIIYWTRLTEFRKLLCDLGSCNKHPSQESTNGKNESSLQTQETSFSDPQDCRDTSDKLGIYTVKA